MSKSIMQMKGGQLPVYVDHCQFHATISAIAIFHGIKENNPAFNLQPRGDGNLVHRKY